MKTTKKGLERENRDQEREKRTVFLAVTIVGAEMEPEVTRSESAWQRREGEDLMVFRVYVQAIQVIEDGLMF